MFIKNGDAEIIKVHENKEIEEDIKKKTAELKEKNKKEKN